MVDNNFLSKIVSPKMKAFRKNKLFRQIQLYPICFNIISKKKKNNGLFTPGGLYCKIIGMKIVHSTKIENPLLFHY